MSFTIRWWHKYINVHQFISLPLETHRELIRQQVNASDAGWYKCEATNHGGSAETEMFINVLCK